MDSQVSIALHSGYAEEDSASAETIVLDASPSAEVVSQNDNVVAWPSFNQGEGAESPDHFIRRNGIEFAGTHLIIDFWGAENLDNLEIMEQAMRDAVEVAGATLLHIHLHHFTPNGGISGVAVLAESHISVHTWPERNYAAFDIFMCGDAQPELAIPVLQAAFTPSTTNLNEHLRGMVKCDD
jgi:S-adenosylmethionine decarboxylase